MRRLLLIIILCKTSCTTKVQDDERAAAIAEMQEKVDKIIVQVRADCDSNIYRLAKYKADSIAHSRNKKRRR